MLFSAASGVPSTAPPWRTCKSIRLATRPVSRRIRSRSSFVFEARSIHGTRRCSRQTSRRSNRGMTLATRESSPTAGRRRRHRQAKSASGPGAPYLHDVYVPTAHADVRWYFPAKRRVQEPSPHPAQPHSTRRHSGGALQPCAVWLRSLSPSCGCGVGRFLRLSRDGGGVPAYGA